MTARPATSLLLLAALGVVGGNLGCSKRSAEPKARAAAPVAAMTGATAEAAKLETPHGSRKMKQLDVPVWVDGKQVSVLRYGELSAALKPRTRHGEEGGPARFYAMDEYAQSLGIAPEKIKAIHALGNREKITTIKGSELLLADNKGRFQFDFMQETTGIAKVDWDTTGLADTYVIHEIRALSIYVEKAPPVVDPTIHCHVAKDGTCSFDDPYAQAEKMKGTRFYLDGRLVGYVKRREIKESVVVGDNASGEHLYSVVKLAQQFGVDPAQVRAAELLNGDDVIARGAGDGWNVSSTALSFTLPKHQHGKVTVRIPASLQVGVEGAKDADATVTAVLLYKNTTPRIRELTAIANVLESPAAAGEVANNDQEDRPTDQLGGGRQH
jgi:DNA-binding transcriptional regulator YhcF (GntR family)